MSETCWRAIQWISWLVADPSFSLCACIAVIQSVPYYTNHPLWTQFALGLIGGCYDLLTLLPIREIPAKRGQCRLRLMQMLGDQGPKRERMPATGWQECSASQSIPIGSSGPRQQSWMLQPKFEHGSLGETYLLSPSAASGPRGAETARRPQHRWPPLFLHRQWRRCLSLALHRWPRCARFVHPVLVLAVDTYPS